jgi:hypothetical protein
MPGTVIVFNCMVQPLTTLLVNKQEVLTAPIPAATSSGASTLILPRGAGHFTDTSKVAVGFGGATSAAWAEYISVPSGTQPWDTLYLWLYVNAYVFCSPDGVVHGTYLQSLSDTFAEAAQKADSKAPDTPEMRNAK